MVRKKCTFKWQESVRLNGKAKVFKSLRLNGKTKVYVKMARLNCTFKWQGKSVLMKRQKCTSKLFKWEDKSVHLNCICKDVYV